MMLQLEPLLNLLRKYGLPLLWLLSVPLLIWGGFINRGIAGGSSAYPFGYVALFALITLVETAVLHLILRPASFHNSWGRTLIALALFFPLSFAARILEDMPGYFYAHALWLVIVVRVLLILLVLSVIFSIIAWVRGRRQRQAAEQAEAGLRR